MFSLSLSISLFNGTRQASRMKSSRPRLEPKHPKVCTRHLREPLHFPWPTRVTYMSRRLYLFCRTTCADTAPRTPRRTWLPDAYVLITVYSATEHAWRARVSQVNRVASAPHVRRRMTRHVSAHRGWSSQIPKFNRGSTFALRRSTLDFCLGGQRSRIREAPTPIRLWRGTRAALIARSTLVQTQDTWQHAG
jgi:hypothetical protein